jgi:hypothetical protein
MISFESKTVVLINVTISEVAVGATVLAVTAADEDDYQQKR